MAALQGLKILVTRPRQQADNLCHLISQQGGEPIKFPLLEVQSVENHEHVSYVLNNLDVFQWVFFISANAVNFALLAINGKITVSSNVAIAAIGQATQRALEAAGWHVDLVPESGFNSEALLKMPALQQLQGQSCLIVRGSGGREFLAEALRQRGAFVKYLEVYKRVIPNVDCSVVLRYINAGMLDAIIITSGEALINLVAMLEADAPQKLRATPLIVLSERINNKAHQMGFNQIVVTEESSDVAIIKAIINGVKSG
jgi:uroporphyrinogen-III synthase